MRSVLFEMPEAGTPRLPCSTPVDPNCFSDMSTSARSTCSAAATTGSHYNDLRNSRPGRRTLVHDITGESTDQLPAGLTIDTPGILDFVNSSTARAT